MAYRHLSHDPDSPLTDGELVIMRILDDLGMDEALPGLEILQKSAGRLRRGPLYVQLSSLEERGFISSKTETEPTKGFLLPRRFYRLTESGRAVTRARRLSREA